MMMNSRISAGQQALRDEPLPEDPRLPDRVLTLSSKRLEPAVAKAGDNASLKTNSKVLPDFPSDQFTIFLFCKACGHDGKLDWDTVPRDVTAEEISNHLCCSRCGAKAGSIRGVYKGARGFGCG